MAKDHFTTRSTTSYNESNGVKYYGDWETFYSYQYTSVSKSSLRTSSGKLVLKPQAFNRWNAKRVEILGRYSYHGSRDSRVLVTQVSTQLRPASGKVARHASDRANAKFYESVGGLKSNLVDIYRTRKETCGMIASRLTQVAQAARAVRRGDFKKASKVLKIPEHKPGSKQRMFSQDWLELSYGWAPLLGDVYALASPFPDIITDVRVSVWDQDTEEESSRPGNYVTWSRGQHLYKARTTITGNVRLKGTAIKAAADLGLTNPLATVWEAVPWSFVVDWVLPIGDYLESMSSLDGLEFFDMSTTDTLEQVSVVELYPNPARGYGNPATGTAVSKQKVRQVGIIPSYPLPSFQNPFSTSHLTNAIALFRTNVR